MGWKKPQATLQSKEISARPMGIPELPELKFLTRDVLSGQSGLGLLPAPSLSLSLSGSSQWEVLPDMHAALSPKVWQSEAVSQPCSLQQVLWKGEVKGHGHQSTLCVTLPFRILSRTFQRLLAFFLLLSTPIASPAHGYLFHS